jgi:nucleotide-binding universal stress UspA family protein
MPVRDRAWAYLRRFRRIERRELQEFRAWVETTRNLIHLTVLLFVPLLIAVVTAVSTISPGLSYLLFPPLASGTFTLFSDPEGKYSTPWKFISGLTIGALCGWFSLITPAAVFFDVGQPIAGVSPAGAALSVFLTGIITWALNAEIPSAFSTALLVLVTGTPSRAGIYVLSIAASSTLVSIVFVLWRREVYAERAQYLYQSTKGDDHVLVPMRGPQPDATAMLGARLAAAHEAGKVVLLHMVDSDAIAVAEQTTDSAERTIDNTEQTPMPQSDGSNSGESISLHDPHDINGVDGNGNDDDNGDGTSDGSQLAEQRAASAFAQALESRAEIIRSEVGVPCEVVVVSEGKNPSRTVTQAAHETNCDLIATPYETHHSSLSPFIRELFVGDIDVVVHRSINGRTDWKRVLVFVRKAGDLAHSMLDFASRLVGSSGHLSACHCITSERQRRRAEEMLADLTETMGTACETRVSRSSVESFFATCEPEYDLVIFGASRDRSAASRFLSPPTFERIDSLSCDVVILDRNL